MTTEIQADIFRASLAVQKLADTLGCKGIEVISSGPTNTTVVWYDDGIAGTALVDVQKGKVYFRDE